MLRGDRESDVSTLDSALDALDGERLLTTTEAASFLGIRSVNTLKLLLRAEGVPTVRRGNRTLVALGEVERLRGGARPRPAGLGSAARRDRRSRRGVGFP